MSSAQRSGRTPVRHSVVRPYTLLYVVAIVICLVASQSSGADALKLKKLKKMALGLLLGGKAKMMEPAEMMTSMKGMMMPMMSMMMMPPPAMKMEEPLEVEMPPMQMPCPEDMPMGMAMMGMD